MADSYSGELAATYASERAMSHPMQGIIHANWMKVVLDAMGSLEGVPVLDIACGSGRSARALARAGAIVTGVDKAPDMIEQALRAEAEEPLGISYLVCDAAELNLGVRFPLATPTFLYHYSRHITVMRSQMRVSNRHLELGGHLIGLSAWQSAVPRIKNNSAWSEWADPTAMFVEGAKIIGHILDADGNEVLSIEYYYWCPETYEHVLEECGFSNISWIPHQLPDELRARYSNWEELETNNISCVFSAIKTREV